MARLGRKRKFAIEELKYVKDKIIERARSLNTLTTDEVILEIQQEILKKKGLNKNANIDQYAQISDQTVASYVKELSFKEVRGKIQASSRVEPFNNIFKIFSLKSFIN